MGWLEIHSKKAKKKKKKNQKPKNYKPRRPQPNKTTQNQMHPPKISQCAWKLAQNR